MIIPIEKKDIEQVKKEHLVLMITINQIKNEAKRAEKIVEEIHRFYRELSI